MFLSFGKQIAQERVTGIEEYSGAGLRPRGPYVIGNMRSSTRGERLQPLKRADRSPEGVR